MSAFVRNLLEKALIMDTKIQPSDEVSDIWIKDCKKTSYNWGLGNIFKNLISLNYRKEILPLQILKAPKKICIFLPLESYELASFVPALKLLKEFFKTSELIGVVREQDALFFERTGLLSEIVVYQSTPFFLSREFFRLRRKIRNSGAVMSIDFNLRSDLLSWVGATPLRIGTQASPFINYKVNIPEEGIPQSALKLVKVICNTESQSDTLESS